MTYLGPCFTVAKADKETCKHPPEALFSWFARDDTLPSGKVQIVVCFACNTQLRTKQPKGKRTRKGK